MSKMEMPLIGLGTWKLNGKECEQTIKQALELGYRHFDTADSYDNHRIIGQAIHSFSRNQLFITSKLWINDLSPEKVKTALYRFLEELDTSYLDLLLIHWPNPDINLIETLNAMVELKEKGLTRHIGVSNFVRFHLDEIAPYNFPIYTNQIEMHPYFQRKPLFDTCKSMKIKITAYRPLAKGAFENNPVLQRIGKKHQKSPAQIVLKWLVEQNITVIPKASSLQHLKENLEIFDFHLTEIDNDEIKQLDCGQRYCAPDGLPVYED